MRSAHLRNGAATANCPPPCRRRGHGATTPASARDPVTEALAGAGQGTSAAAIVRRLDEADDEMGLGG